jgi:hypothetical protein
MTVRDEKKTEDSDDMSSIIEMIIWLIVLLGLIAIFQKIFRRIQPSIIDVKVSDSVSLLTDASLIVVSPGNVVVDESVSIDTGATLNVTPPSTQPPGNETNVTIDDSVDISTNASLSVS